MDGTTQTLFREEGSPVSHVCGCTSEQVLNLRC